MSPKSDKDPTFFVAVSEYIAHIDTYLRATTIRTYCQICRNLIDIIGVGTRLSKVEENQELADISNQTRSVLAGIYDLARKTREYDGPDPTQGLERKKKKPAAPIDVYTPAEILQLGDATESAQDRALFLCAGFAGLRLSELRALRWRDIDTEKKIIHVRRGYTNESGFAPTKSGKERAIPMARHVRTSLQYLAWYRATQNMEITDNQDELIFRNEDGGVIDGSCLYRRFIAASKKAGLRRLRFHDLRHSAISVMVQVYPIADVMYYAGHASLETTLRYIHFAPRTEAASRLDALIGQNRT